MPQRNEASTNRIVAHRNSFTSPKRRLSQPVSGSAIALLTAKEVITQVPCSELTPRLPEMVGNATLAMVVSSTCMKVANDSPMVLSSRLGGVKDALLLMVNPLKPDGRCAAVDVGGASPLARVAGQWVKQLTELRHRDQARSHNGPGHISAARSC